MAVNTSGSGGQGYATNPNGFLSSTSGGAAAPIPGATAVQQANGGGIPSTVSGGQWAAPGANGVDSFGLFSRVGGGMSGARAPSPTAPPPGSGVNALPPQLPPGTSAGAGLIANGGAIPPQYGRGQAPTGLGGRGANGRVVLPPPPSTGQITGLQQAFQPPAGLQRFGQLGQLGSGGIGSRTMAQRAPGQQSFAANAPQGGGGQMQAQSTSSGGAPPPAPQGANNNILQLLGQLFGGEVGSAAGGAAGGVAGAAGAPVGQGIADFIKAYNQATGGGGSNSFFNFLQNIPGFQQSSLTNDVGQNMTSMMDPRAWEQMAQNQLTQQNLAATQGLNTAERRIADLQGRTGYANPGGEISQLYTGYGNQLAQNERNVHNDALTGQMNAIGQAGSFANANDAQAQQRWQALLGLGAQGSSADYNAYRQDNPTGANVLEDLLGAGGQAAGAGGGLAGTLGAGGMGLLGALLMM